MPSDQSFPVDVGEFDGTPTEFTYVEYTTTPAYCQQLLTYTYSETVSPSQTTVAPNNDDNSFDFNADKTMSTTYEQADYQGGMSGGVFTYKYNVCIPNSNPANCEALEIEQTMKDPCNPPISIDLQGFALYTEYTVANTVLPYTHPEVTIDPSFCNVDIVYTIPAFNNGLYGITEPTGDDRTFNIFYDNDLDVTIFESF